MDKTDLNLNKIKKEHLLLAYAILLIGIAFFAYKQAFAPLIGKIKTTTGQIKQKEASIQRARISPEALGKLEKEINAVKGRMQYYEERLKAEADVPQILKELDRIGERLKIKFVSVNPLTREEIPLPEGQEVLLEIPIKIKLRCGYHQLGLFINYLENSTRFIKIINLTVNADAQDTWTHNAELTITSFNLSSKGSKI